MSNQNMGPVAVYFNGKRLEGVEAITLNGTVTISARSTNGNDRNPSQGHHHSGTQGSAGGCTCGTCTLGRAGAAQTAGTSLSAIPAAQAASYQAIERAKRQMRLQREFWANQQGLVWGTEPLDSIFELPQEHQELPVLGHRAVRLHADADNDKLLLMSQVRSTPLEPLSEATCGRSSYDPNPGHEVPGLTCECGFWAIKPGEREQYEGVQATVELSGRVIEGDVGYRAQWQRILELRLPICVLCKNPQVERVAKFPKGSRALCSSCKQRGGPASFDALWVASLSPVPMYYADGTRVDG